MKTVLKRELVAYAMLYVAIFYLIFFIRSLYMWNVTNLNEGHYLTINLLVDHGYKLYVDIPDNKPPLFYLINYLFYKVFGNSIFYFRLIMVTFATGTALFIYKSLKLIYNKYVGLVGAILFSITSSSPWFFNYALQTHTYCAFFVSVGMYMLIFVLKNYDNNSKVFRTLLSGIFLALATLTRHTGLIIAIFFLIAILIKKRYKLCKYYVLGLILPLLFSVLILVCYSIDSFTFIDKIFYTIKVSVYSNSINWSSFIDINKKIKFFADIVYAILPLWILSSCSILSHHKQNAVEMILRIWLISLTGLIIFGPVPGYHGYYYDILIPLSTLGAIGLYNLYKYAYNTIDYGSRVQLIIIFTIIILFSSYVSLIKNMYNPDMVPEEDDFRTIIKISNFLKSHTSSNDRVFVWEKDSPKIGPYIYIFSNRIPPVPFTFLFPYASKENINCVIKGLSQYNVTYVVIISSGKSVFNQKILDKYIMLHYIPIQNFGKIKTYKWLPPQEVRIYKRYNIDKSQVVLKLNLSSSSIAKSSNTKIIYKPLSNNSAEILVRFNGSGWISLLYELKEPLDLSREMLVLELPIYSVKSKFSNINEKLLLHIDLIDGKKNWRRLTLDLKNSTYFIPLREDLFGPGIDYQTIKRIHISIEKRDHSNITLRMVVAEPKIIKMT